MNTEKYYLIDHIRKNMGLDEDILESIKYELDQRIYYYGENFKLPKERPAAAKAILRSVLNKAAGECKYALNVLSKNKPGGKGGRIISNSYFSVNDELRKIGYDVYEPFWSGLKKCGLMPDGGLYREFIDVKELLDRGSFADIISKEFFETVKRFKGRLRSFYESNDIRALVVPNDISFFENLSVKIFREMGRPSFLFIHGLPGRYNTICENKTDHLVVWGGRIKDNYIKAGLAESKILVSGHAQYKESSMRELRYGLEDILIVTKSMPGAQFSEGIRLSDRSDSILYLYSIQKALKKIGVRSARLRPHPSENCEWYFKFIDRDFFKPDTESLAASLEKSTLVIGPASTVFLEAIYHGVNYLVYEPVRDGRDLMDIDLVPPFDGKDAKVPVARDEDELERLLSGKVKADRSVFNDYIKTPFDISFMKDHIR